MARNKPLCNVAYMSFFPCSPWMREGPSLGAMILASILSALLMVRGPGSGISMSSSLRVRWPFSWKLSCDAKRARF